MKLKDRKFTRQAITYFVVTGLACLVMLVASVITILDLFGHRDLRSLVDVSLVAAFGSIIVSLVFKKRAEASMITITTEQQITEGA